jgi:hypothetical protein
MQPNLITVFVSAPLNSTLSQSNPIPILRYLTKQPFKYYQLYTKVSQVVQM